MIRDICLALGCERAYKSMEMHICIYYYYYTPHVIIAYITCIFASFICIVAKRELLAIYAEYARPAFCCFSSDLLFTYICVHSFNATQTPCALHIVKHNKYMIIVYGLNNLLNNMYKKSISLFQCRVLNFK